MFLGIFRRISNGKSNNKYLIQIKFEQKLVIVHKSVFTGLMGRKTNNLNSTHSVVFCTFPSSKRYLWLLRCHDPLAIHFTFKSFCLDMQQSALPIYKSDFLCPLNLSWHVFFSTKIQFARCLFILNAFVLTFCGP